MNSELIESSSCVRRIASPSRGATDSTCRFRSRAASGPRGIVSVTTSSSSADFYEVNLTERLTVSVPLRFVGKPVGVVEGGILQPIQREVEVECLPTEIPEFVEIDVSALRIHEAVHVGELRLPEGVTALGDAARPLVTVLPPTVEEKPAEAAEAAPVEGAPAEAGAAAAAPAAEAAAAGKPAAGKKGGEG